MISVVVITPSFPLTGSFLKSLEFADEIIVVVDTDKAIKEPKNKKIRLYSRKLNQDFASQRNFALEKARFDWVFFVDDDEYIGTELAREIKEKTKQDTISGFVVKRQDVVYHQILRHGETGDTKILRLGKKVAGTFSRSVHETWKINGLVGELSNPLYHIKDHFVSEFIGRMDRYGIIDSLVLLREGKPFSLIRLLVNPAGKFNLNYFFKKGFLDGYAGLFHAYLMAVQSLSVRVFQWENLK